MSDDYTDTDHHRVMVLAELARSELDGTAEPATIKIGPFTAYVLVGLIQLACRHPELHDAQLRAAHRVADPLTTLFGPPLREEIEKGWDPVQDRCTACGSTTEEPHEPTCTIAYPIL